MSESESSPTKAAPAAPVAADVLCMVELDTVAESELDSELSESETESDESLDDDAAPALYP